jgi:hypothetical protein
MTAVWTAPRTWVAHETPTEAMLNAHWRDNMEFLKLVRGATGKFLDLTTATFDSVNANALSDVVSLAGNNVPAGVNDYSAGMFKLPVGADKYDGAPGNKTAGSVWVEGTALHYVTTGKIEHAFLGIYVSSPGIAYAGFMRIMNAQLRYIDAVGDVRYCGGSLVDTPPTAISGRVGILDYLQWIAGNSQNRYRSFVNAHGDSTHTDDTVPHSDTPAYSDHTDGTSHTDTGGVHTDYPTHTDYGSYPSHGDTTVHTDSSTPHTDTNPHTDSGADTDHVDVPGSHNDLAPYSDYQDQPTVVGP